VPVLLLFAAVMGVTYLSTVPPTATLVARFFGPAHMATLFGGVMVTHQIGAFLGAWLGGLVYQSTGGYGLMWAMDVALAAAAALVHLPIREAVPAGRAQLAAA
jgi:predicted MFS family arabinose efflux permease